MRMIAGSSKNNNDDWQQEIIALVAMVNDIGTNDSNNKWCY